MAGYSFISTLWKLSTYSFPESMVGSIYLFIYMYMFCPQVNQHIDVETGLFMDDYLSNTMNAHIYVSLQESVYIYIQRFWLNQTKWWMRLFIGIEIIEKKRDAMNPFPCLNGEHSLSGRWVELGVELQGLWSHLEGWDHRYTDIYLHTSCHLNSWDDIGVAMMPQDYLLNSQMYMKV